LSAKLTYDQQSLVAALRLKHNEAFSYLYEHFADALHGVIRLIVRDNELSNDVLQETFVNIWRKIDS
jgi:DNA-directed RNA polymerase specialized sigma24 family protein